MCRHLAYLGPPRSLASLLYEAAHSLEEQSWKPLRQRAGAMNADGWGVGWWDPLVRPEPARYRTAAPMWTDRSFRSVAEVVHAGAFIAAVRSATPPSPIVETGNAPFVAGPWLFSLNGYVRDFRGPVGEALRREVSEERAIAIEGTSDSEVAVRPRARRPRRRAPRPRRRSPEPSSRPPTGPRRSSTCCCTTVTRSSPPPGATR